MKSRKSICWKVSISVCFECKMLGLLLCLAETSGTEKSAAEPFNNLIKRDWRIYSPERPYPSSDHFHSSGGSRTQPGTAMNASSLNMSTSPGPAACICEDAMNSYTLVNNLLAAGVSALLAVFTAFSNVVVMVTVIRTASLHTQANILLCSLAFGDFLVAVFSLPLLVAILAPRNAGVDCCWHNSLDEIHSYSLVIVLGCTAQVCVMCWDRFKATNNPIRYRAEASNKKIILITVTAWVASIIDAAVTRLVVLPQEVKTIKMSVELAVMVIICLVYLLLSVKSVRIVGDVVPQAIALAREKKMTVTLRWIIGAGFLSVFPLIVYFVSAVIIGRDSLFRALLSPWAKIALFSNSAVNPIIYFWRHASMRSAALALVRS